CPNRFTRSVMSSPPPEPPSPQAASPPRATTAAREAAIRRVRFNVLPSVGPPSGHGSAPMQCGPDHVMTSRDFWERSHTPALPRDAPSPAPMRMRGPEVRGSGVGGLLLLLRGLLGHRDQRQLAAIADLGD